MAYRVGPGSGAQLALYGLRLPKACTLEVKAKVEREWDDGNQQQVRIDRENLLTDVCTHLRTEGRNIDDSTIEKARVINQCVCRQW